MNLSRLKITDGDLLIVTYSNTMAWSDATILLNSIKEWVEKSRLNDVKVLSCCESGSGISISITVLSAIDVFETEILK